MARKFADFDEYQLHITSPVHHVMALIGKKYPASLEQFYAAHLPGTFDPALAG